MTYVFLAATAFFIAGAYWIGITQIPLLGFGDPLGPKLLPSFLAAALVAVGCALLVEGRSIAGLKTDFTRFSTFVRTREFGLIAAVTCWTALYFTTFTYLGYLLSTSLFLTVLMATAHRGNRLVAVTVAISFSVGSYLLFALLFAVPLPRGILPF